MHSEKLPVVDGQSHARVQAGSTGRRPVPEHSAGVGAGSPSEPGNGPEETEAAGAGAKMPADGSEKVGPTKVARVTREGPMGDPNG